MMNTTCYRLVVCEKPSVARSIAAVIGAGRREDGFLSGGGYLVSWCFGHLAELSDADAYDEKYPDMTCFLALRNIERKERKERRNRMKENWIYRRGDVYLANLDPYIGSEQGGTRPVVVLQNNTGNYYCPTLIIAPITSKAGKKPSQPTHYYAERIHGLDVPGMVLLEQIKTIDKRRVKKYMGRMTRQQMDEIGEAIEEALGLYVPEEMEAP